MQVVHKYPLKLGEQVIEMPRGAKILSARMQDGVPVIWALVNPDAELAEWIERKIEVCQTGEELSDQAREHIDTLQGEVTVWHVFELLDSRTTFMVELSLDDSQVQELAVRGMNSSRGESIVVSHIQRARTRGRQV